MGCPRTTVRRTARHLLVALFATCLWQAGAHAGTTVQDIHKRGTLRCGVSDAVPGLAARDAAGRWQGLETDFCRAVAAAVLGDAEKRHPLRPDRVRGRAGLRGVANALRLARDERARFSIGAVIRTS
ncbi:MAG: hypothetical protein IPM40_04565 [Gammaproteobacteria bacterium]|nr:hypothetical protein [Gammaproteobacteria bacterium]